MLRYQILNEDQRVKVVDTISNSHVTPDCGHDLELYCAYLVCKRQGNHAHQQVLQETIE